MPRKKQVSVEIVPKPEAMDIRAVIDRMVDERLAAREADLMDPGYRSKALSNEIRVQQNVFNRVKWGLYFEKWGCQSCGRKKNVNHASGGHCTNCSQRIYFRLKQIKREYELNNPEVEINRQIDRLSSRFRSAEALLGKE